MVHEFKAVDQQAGTAGPGAGVGSAPSNSASAAAKRPSTRTITGRIAKDHVRDIKSHLDALFDLAFLSEQNLATFSAESQQLKAIMLDWACGCWSSEYPGELPLIAAIRGNLERKGRP